MNYKTPSPFAKNFYDFWDNIIRDWLVNEQNLNSFMDGKQSLSIGHVPEPYYGDMDNCSIVIINLNPGTGLCEQCWQEQDKQGTLVNYIKMNSYSRAAIDFPLDNPQSQVPMPTASLNWWKSRLLWIDRVLDSRGISKEDRKKPFAIELVPLHSKSFNVADAAKYVKKRYNDLLPIIEHAIWASDSKMGLAIGRPIYEVLTKNGYNSIHGPVKGKSKQGKERTYCVIEKDQTRILCTWARWANTAPADGFKDYEKNEIITKFF